jgi:hypothetical protein
MVRKFLASLDILICNELVGPDIDEGSQKGDGSDQDEDSHQDEPSDSEYWPIQSQFPDGDPRG